MNNFKQMMKIFIVALLVSATTASCQDNYSNLEDGLYAEFQTNKGTMVAKLYFEKAPVTVANFVALADGTHPKVADTFKGKRFYDGIMFHRVMDQFMIQAGDHTATGSGNPGYRFHSEFSADLKHSKPGILSMANSGGLGTNGTQFFITEKVSQSTTNLNAFLPDGTLKDCAQRGVSCHAVFGEIVMGMEVHDSISNVPVSKERATMNKPLQDVVINKLNIIRKGSAAKTFDAAKIFTEDEPKLAERHKALQDQQVEMLKERAKAAAVNFKEANKDLGGEIFESPTGILMILNKAKNGTKLKSTDKALVNCSAYFMDGNLLYTTYADVAKEMNQYNEQQDKQGAYKPFAMIYNESAKLVSGFREAMLRMNVGDKARVYVPSYLGYGAAGRPPRVPGNTDLYFDIEIAGIQK